MLTAILMTSGIFQWMETKSPRTHYNRYKFYPHWVSKKDFRGGVPPGGNRWSKYPGVIGLWWLAHINMRKHALPRVLQNEFPIPHFPCINSNDNKK